MVASITIQIVIQPFNPFASASVLNGISRSMMTCASHFANNSVGSLTSSRLALEGVVEAEPSVCEISTADGTASGDAAVPKATLDT
jgi:hypothetical protein